MSEWNVERLDVFQKAYRLSLDVHRASKSFPKDEQYGGVADQIRRASKSVPALLTEGAARGASSPKEFRRYCVMAIGSGEEAKLWTAYAGDLGYMDRGAADRWRADFSEIGRMLNGLLKRLSDN